MDYVVEYYEKSDGSRPAEEFILSQDNKMQAKIFAALELLELKGPALREPFSKPLGDGIFEVRAKQGSDISRVLYFFVVGKRVILTNGFIKKTAKTPPREIERAKRSSLFPSSRKRCEQMIQETIFSAQHTRTALRSEGSI